MKKLILLICLMFLAVQNTYAVEAGLYHCSPVHAAHLIKDDDGTVSQVMINTEGVISIIVINASNIDISDNRSEQRKLIKIISNASDGAIQGHTGYRYFYMNNVLHYFYGATGENDSAAYAEDGLCSKLTR